MPCPVRPQPLKNKASLFFTFFVKRNSWLSGLFERSYVMKTGKVKLPGIEIVIASELPLVKKIMIDEVDKYPKNNLLHTILEPLLGESIFTSNGCQWRKQRDLMNPAFAYARVGAVFGLMQQACDDMLARFSTIKQDNNIRDMDAEMTFVTADIIFRTIMTTKLEAEAAERITVAFTHFQHQSLRISMLKMFNIPSFLCGFKERKRQKAAKEIRGTLEHLIRPRYEEISCGDKTQWNDILSTLLNTIDPETNERFSFKEIVDQVAMLFLAGHETSASALSWTFYLLAEYPEIQQQAFKEIQNIVGDAKIKKEDIKKLTLVTAIFRESLRLYPPVGFMAREAQQQVTLRDKIVAKGKTVIVSPWLIHRNKNNWVKPHEFNPQRFLQSHEIPLKSKYLPFGMGQRLCVGASFAMQEAVLIIASLLQHYRIKKVAGFEPKPVGRLTIRSENGINVHIINRF
jgi:cytochrome P450